MIKCYIVPHVYISDIYIYIRSHLGSSTITPQCHPMVDIPSDDDPNVVSDSGSDMFDDTVMPNNDHRPDSELQCPPDNEDMFDDPALPDNDHGPDSEFQCPSASSGLSLHVAAPQDIPSDDDACLCLPCAPGTPSVPLEDDGPPALVKDRCCNLDCSSNASSLRTIVAPTREILHKQNAHDGNVLLMSLLKKICTADQ